MKKRSLIIGIGTLIFIIVAVAFILVFYPNAKNTETEISREQLNNLSEEQCLSEGYDWVSFPGLCAPPNGCGSRCDIPTSDAGKACYSNSDCEGVCSCQENKKDSEGYQKGKCSMYKYFTEISDCPCILTEKSTTGNFPYCM